MGGSVTRRGSQEHGRASTRAVAAAHLSVLDEASPTSSARTAVESTLRERVVGSATGGGLLRRETPYLAIAAGDPEWIAAERAVIERFAAEDDQRVRCFMNLADAVLALLGGDTHRRRTSLARSPRRVQRTRFRSALGRRPRGAGDLRKSGGCDRRGGAAGRRGRVGAHRPRVPVPVPAPRRAAGRIRRGPSTLAGGSDGVRTPVTRATSSAHVGLGRSDTDRSRGRPSCRRRAHQPAGRREIVHERANRQDPPPAHLRQARDRQPLPTRRRGRRTTSVDGARHPTSAKVIPPGLPTSSLSPCDSIPSCRPISSRRSMLPDPDRTRLGP